MLIAMLMSLMLGGQEPDTAPSADLLQSLGMAPIEEEAATGAVVYRALFTDGYGRDTLSVSFEMRPNAPPMVVVYGYEGEKLFGEVTAETWDQISNEAQLADRRLVALPPPDGVEFICLHGWGAAIEMANSFEPWQGSNVPVRRSSYHTCDEDDSGSLTLRFALSMAEEALQSLPACRLLEDAERIVIRTLNLCLGLRGNTLIAANLAVERGLPETLYRTQDAIADDWDDWLATDGTSRLDWAGDVYEEAGTLGADAGETSLPTVLVALSAEHRRLAIVQRRFGAVDRESGWIEGQIGYAVRPANPDDDWRYMVADYRQEWSRVSGWLWQMTNWTVGPFREVKADDE